MATTKKNNPVIKIFGPIMPGRDKGPAVTPGKMRGKQCARFSVRDLTRQKKGGIENPIFRLTAADDLLNKWGKFFDEGALIFAEGYFEQTPEGYNNVLLLNCSVIPAGDQLLAILNGAQDYAPVVSADDEEPILTITADEATPFG